MSSTWWTILLLALPGALPAAEPCRPIDGIQSLLQPGRVLLLGEIHGTVESPAFTAEIACHAALADLPVIVGVELSTGDQPRVDAFMNSQGGEEDRHALLSGPQWQSSYQDGRASHAMLELIDRLRRLRRKGRDVRVAMFDAPAVRGAQQRDRDMAENLAEVVSSSLQAVVIVLTGNNHSRITEGTPRSPSFEPMGYLLGRLVSFERLTALNVAHGGGSAWICAPECGVRDLGGRHGELAWAVEIDEATRPAGHSGWYHVGTITASPPAKLPRFEVPLHTPKSTEAPAPGQVGSVESEQRAVPERIDTRPLSGTESRLQGSWQAYDHATRGKTWRFRFDGRAFRAQGAPEDWYEGHIAIDDQREPAQIDFTIDDCKCAYKDMTSEAIFAWNGASLVIAAPEPGEPRPQQFLESSGQMMLLVPALQD
jgi:uncharacterized protein (TIGR03067 family)